MRKKTLLNHIICLLFCFSFISCTEPYQMQSNTYEDALVIEATITNQLKKQQIKITHTYQLEESAPTIETGAEVYITDNMGNQYDFVEENGIYLSIVAFQAIPNVNYQLFITTRGGEQYRSNIQKLTTVNEITSVDTDITIEDSQRGVQISVNSFDPTNTSKFYRYEYEETYKVISPKWSEYKAIVIGPNHNFFSYTERGYESKTCYKTLKSTDFILTNTSNFTEDRITKFPIRFIADDDYIISQRYSILVRQYIASQDAYLYYETIKALSDSGELLSPNQPGFINGNIKSITNSKEKVVGFFDVTSVSEKRIFFNYQDVFPNEQPPPFFMDCPEEHLHSGDWRITPVLGDAWKLKNYIESGQKVFFDFIYLTNDPYNSIYVMVPAPCGDCTSFASNIVPPFWQ